MLASTLLQPENDPPEGGDVLLEMHKETRSGASSDLSDNSSIQATQTSVDEYVQLQLRIYRTALLVSVFAVLLTGVFCGLHFSISLLVGAISGLLYLRLLARSVGRLGETTKSVGKAQLVVPVLLVLAASKLPQLDLIPSLLGFLLYKPSLILQLLLES